MTDNVIIVKLHAPENTLRNVPMTLPVMKNSSLINANWTATIADTLTRVRWTNLNLVRTKLLTNMISF